MSETIDSLLVSLGLETDAKSFQKANDAIKGVKDGVLQLAAAAGVGFGVKALTSDLAKSTLEMDRLSKITGFTVKQIDALRYAMRRNGLDPDSANALVQKIPAWRQAASQGELGDKAYWNGNFNPSEMIGKSNNEILEYIAESYGKMNNDQRRTLRSGLGLGENDDITRFLEGGIKNIKDASSEFEKLYRPIDQSLIDSANKFNKEMATLSTSFESLQRQIGGPLLSSVNEFLNRINEFTQENQNEINTGAQMAINGDWYNWLMDDASKRGIDFRNKLRDWGVIDSAKETFIPSVDMNKYQPQQHAQSSIKSNSSGNERTLFDKLERERGLPSGLLNSTYQKESGGGKHLLSPKGAMGPFQFMPDTANDMGLKGDDVYDLEKSATAAANYYRQLLDRYNGDVPKAVAAYNHGMGNIDKKGLSNLPKETRDYVPSVLGGLDNGDDLLADYNYRKNQVPIARGGGNNGGTPVTVNQNNNVTIHAGGADAVEVENRLANAFTSYSQQARDLMDTEHY